MHTTTPAHRSTIVLAVVSWSATGCWAIQRRTFSAVRRAFVQRPVRRGGRNSHLGTLGKQRLRRDIRFGSGDRHTTCTAHVAPGLSSPLATRCSRPIEFVKALTKRRQSGLFYALFSVLRSTLEAVNGVSSRTGSEPCQGSRAPLRGAQTFPTWLAGCGWAIGFCPGDHCAPPKTILPSVSRMSRVDLRPHQSRTRRDTIKHRLTRSQLAIQLAQYRAAAGACSESVASP